MNPSCPDIRELLLECRGIPRSGDLELVAHLEACSECAAFAGSTASIARSVSLLPRRAAPHELDGQVVAAMQAGHREDRAARAVTRLSRLPVPASLDVQALESSSPRAQAPAVLDRLVDEDLRDQASAMARRFTGRLVRHKAPRDLRDRLTNSAQGLLRPRTARRILPVAAGLMLLLLGGGWLLRRGVEQRRRDVSFEVVYESSLENMDPMARSLLAGLSGGLVDVGAGEAPR